MRLAPPTRSFLLFLCLLTASSCRQETVTMEEAKLKVGELITRHSSGEEAKKSLDRLGFAGQEALIDALDDPSLSDESKELALRWLLTFFPSENTDNAVFVHAGIIQDPQKKERFLSMAAQIRSQAEREKRLPPVMHILLFIVFPLLQIGLAAHAGLNGHYGWAVGNLLVPVLAPILYFWLHVVPEIRHKIDAHEERNPNLGRLRDLVKMADTLENKEALANGCIKAGLYDEAIRLYEECRRAGYQDDPTVLWGLARGYFAVRRHTEAEGALDKLMKIDKDGLSSEPALLRARNLEKLGDIPGAIAALRDLCHKMRTPETLCRLAVLLEGSGAATEAATLFEEARLWGKIATRTQKKSHKEWLSMAARRGPAGAA